MAAADGLRISECLLRLVISAEAARLLLAANDGDDASDCASSAGLLLVCAADGCFIVDVFEDRLITRNGFAAAGRFIVDAFNTCLITDEGDAAAAGRFMLDVVADGVFMARAIAKQK